MTVKQIIEKADFEKGDGLLPAIIQDCHTGKVLMMGYMNKKALKQSEKTGKVTFYSRSKERLWTKGESSGNHIAWVSAELDCDRDALLVMGEPSGPVCHTGADTCWKESNKESFGYLYELESVIKDRKKNPLPDSYTNRLFSRGINKIAQKVGEEAVELVIEAKDNNKGLFKGEMADLLYHLSVMMVEKNVEWTEVFDVLRKRRK